MSRYIPSEITKAPKQGFSSPDASWFKGDSIEFVRHTLLNDRSPLFELLDFNSVKSLVDQHLNGEKNRRLLVWSLLNVDFLLKDIV